MRQEIDKIYDINIERAVLSALIMDKDILLHLDETPSSDIFFLPQHKDIYNAILFLIDIDKPVTEEFIINRLISLNVFDDKIFLDVIASNPITDFKVYIAELEEFRKKRELLSISSKIKTKLGNGESSEDIIDFIETALLSLSSDQKQQGFLNIKDILTTANKHLAQIQTKKDGLAGIDTGFAKLNGLTNGFNSGDLIILAARPSMGKTSLALNIIIETAKSKNGVALFSLEMPREQIGLRMMSIVSGVPLHDIRAGKISLSQQNSISQANNLLKTLEIVVDDTSVLTMRQIRSKIKRLVAKNTNIKLVVIDYLQLIDSNNNKDRHLQVSDISRGLKLLARELNISILALSQLNRSLESRADKRPMMSDLRESGAIEQDADVILFIYREDVYKKQEDKQKESEMRSKGIDFVSNFKDDAISKAELIIGKQRNGPLGFVELEFVKSNASFREKEHGVKKVFEIDFQ